MAEHSTHPSSDREAMPHGLYEHDGRLKIVIAGLDQNVRAQAVEAANERLNEELGEGGFTKKFVKGVWKGNVAREYYLAKYTSDAEAQIREHENLLQHEGLSAEQYQTATTLRFAHEYDDMLHQGEKRHAVLDQNEDGSHNNEGYALKQRIFRLVEGYAAGKFATEDDFHEEKKRLMTEAVEQGLTKDHIGEGLLYTDNLLQIAQNVKAMVDYRVATGESGNIDEILSNTDIVLGDARLGARTEAELSPTERIMKKLEGKAFVSETTMVTAVSAVYSVGSWATKTAIGAAGRAVALGLGSGMTAALREKRMLKEERAQHSREMALGKGDPEKLSGRREALEEARYETKNAREMTEQIGLMYAPEGDFKVADKATFDEALGMLAESQARIRVSDKRNIDLISYSEVGVVEKERFELDLALAKAKCDLRSFMESATDDELKVLGIAPGDIPGLRSGGQDILDFVLTPQIDAVEGMLVEGSDDYEGIAQKDRIYAKVRARRMGKAFLKGTVLGMAIGTAAQEAAAFALDSKQGLIESAVGFQDNEASHQTLLEGMFSPPESPIELGDGHVSDQLGEYSKFNLPEGFDAARSGDTLTVTGPEGLEVDGLSLDANGRLTAEAESRLELAGFKIGFDEGVVPKEVSHDIVSTPEKFVDAHSDQVTHITRDFWYDNGSPSPDQANGLELGLQPVTVNENGDYVVTMTGLEDGAFSSSGGEMDYGDSLEGGHVQVALSASEGTQSTAFMLDLQPTGDGNGEAIISKDSTEARLFSRESNGEVTYNGKYMEAVEVANTDDVGVTHVRPLATVEGAASDSIPDTRVEIENHPSSIYTLDYEAPPTERLVDIPPVVPIYSRSGLEVLRGKARTSVRGPESSPSGFYYGVGPEDLQQWMEQNQARVRTRTREKVDGSYIWREADGSEVKRDTDRERAVIGNYLDSIRNSDPTYFSYLEKLLNERTMNAMDNDCRVSVNIPAWMEEKNIYKLLEMYVNQTDKNGNPIPASQFEINVIVNRKTGSVPDNTVGEIERFLRESGAAGRGYKINYIDVEFDPPLNNVGHARHVLTDLNLLRSLNRPAQAESLYIESEDADIMRLDEHTVFNIIDKMDRNPHLDAVRGMQDRNPDILKQNDYLFVSRRLWDFTEALARSQEYRPENNNEKWNPMFNRIFTGGWNTAYTAEAYALIGGYDSSMVMGEDSMIGQRISAIRGDGKTHNTHTVGNVYSRTDSSPRRFIGEVMTGRGAYSSDFNDEKLNKLIREASIDELMDKIKDFSRIDASNDRQFKDLLSGYYDFAKDFTPNESAAKSMFKRIMVFIGVDADDYEFVSNADGEWVTIKDLSGLKQRLDDYRAKHPAPAIP